MDLEKQERERVRESVCVCGGGWVRGSVCVCVCVCVWLCVWLCVCVSVCNNVWLKPKTVNSIHTRNVSKVERKKEITRLQRKHYFQALLKPSWRSAAIEVEVRLCRLSKQNCLDHNTILARTRTYAHPSINPGVQTCMHTNEESVFFDLLLHYTMHTETLNITIDICPNSSFLYSSANHDSQLHKACPVPD